ncbi:flavodoxin domain-containing protein [Aminipila sp.]|uniref:flavodoxin domain-containing protein n=1 Tax=Aminipila sp. TaxID=2060095 RepID=UPI00289B0635|nr:flavodoxin domain-containing protein [Aminipila sp.]
MNRIVVIYQSHYGTTKKYAEWIAEELNADLYEKEEIKQKKILNNYEIIIFGGALYAGGIKGISIIKDNFNLLKDKKLIVFTCGLADPKDQENLKGLRKSIDKAFTAEEQKNIEFFHLRGGIDYRKLNTVHKIMMAMLKHQLMKKDPALLNEEDKQMLETYGKRVDFTDKAATEPIIAQIKNRD